MKKRQDFLVKYHQKGLITGGTSRMGGVSFCRISEGMYLIVEKVWVYQIVDIVNVSQWRKWLGVS